MIIIKIERKPKKVLIKSASLNAPKTLQRNITIFAALLYKICYHHFEIVIGITLYKKG